jgi:serine/threonine protein phosphatase 1
MNSRIFAIGDIHGCFDAFRELVENKLNLQRTDKLVLLGDYIDRGSQTRQVIDYILKLQQDDFQLIALKGNHEAMLMNAYHDNYSIPIWIYNGGHATFRSFGIKKLADLDPSYIAFFSSLPYYYLNSDVLFVHAGFNDRIEDPFSDNQHMIWHCSSKYTNPRLVNCTIIHGHSPIPLLQLKEILLQNSKVINIDTGCVFNERQGYGHLSAIEINTRTLFYV